MTPEEKVKTWFEHSDTPEHAWKEWTLEQIATDAGCSVSSVLKYLPDLVKTRHPEVTDYIQFRKIRKDAARKQYKKGELLPDEDVARIRELRRVHTIHEVSAMTGFSPSTVHRYSQ